jgi:hypothetical protein
LHEKEKTRFVAVFMAFLSYSQNAFITIGQRPEWLRVRAAPLASSNFAL